MKFKELNNKPKEELREQLKELKIKLAKFKFDVQTNNLKDVSQIRKSKDDIARVLTALNSDKK